MLVQLDPRTKAIEREIAALEASLAAPPADDATEDVLRFHVHRLFCGFSAFMRKGEEQEEVEDPMVEAVRGVPLWAIEAAVATFFRPPATKYPPSASAVRERCDLEIARVRYEIFRLRRELRSAPPCQAPAAGEAENRDRMKALFAGLRADLGRAAAERELVGERLRPLAAMPIPVVGEREPRPHAEPEPAAAQAQRPAEARTDRRRRDPARTGTKS